MRLAHAALLTASACLRVPTGPRCTAVAPVQFSDLAVEACRLSDAQFARTGERSHTPTPSLESPARSPQPSVAQPRALLDGVERRQTPTPSLPFTWNRRASRVSWPTAPREKGTEAFESLCCQSWLRARTQPCARSWPRPTPRARPSRRTPCTSSTPLAARCSLSSTAHRC